MSIAENLHRAELTALQRSDQVAEWVRLTEAKRERDAADTSCGSSLSDGRKAGHQHQPSGVRAASKELGINREAARRAVTISNKLTDEETV